MTASAASTNSSPNGFPDLDAEAYRLVTEAQRYGDSCYALIGRVLDESAQRRDFQFFRPQEGRYAPARAIIEQFERIREECAQDPSRLGAWYPIIQQYGTSLITECENHERLAKRLVSEWLKLYMFQGCEDAAARSEAVATWFADYNAHQSHGLGIDRDAARQQGVEINDLEEDPRLQDLVLSVFHATMHTFGGLAVKIIENHFGRAFVKIEQQLAIPQMQIQPQPQP